MIISIAEQLIQPSSQAREPETVPYRHTRASRGLSYDRGGDGAYGLYFDTVVTA